ncbi:VOC family protein [Aestuariispira insulae]|uniref:Putative enzyme related to lactoylglutathione lyase n=1 Tax=Aestuariispira insulae TaxID=1461337 RepID=A0A3D9HF04_9PROT|nr:VOC family protein [Aestuariispira insulae]RED48053.1 putative enzyme related to lactoylglutathione lyase [Aestuariispira insulae]
MQRVFSNILANDVDRTASFYEALLGMRRHFNSGWFVILTHDGMPGLEYGILKRDSDIVPPDVREAPQGVIITFVVEDCDLVHQIAQEMKADIIQPPTDMPYGQRRMLLRDPEGAVLDISAPTAAVTVV